MSKDTRTREQRARDILERLEMPGAQTLSAGDVSELAQLLDAYDDLMAACDAAGSLCENIRLGCSSYEDATPYVRQLIDAALAKAKLAER